MWLLLVIVSAVYSLFSAWIVLWALAKVENKPKPWKLLLVMTLGGPLTLAILLFVLLYIAAEAAAHGLARFLSG